MSTTARNFRIDDETYHAAQQRAAGEGTSVSELVRQWLGDYAAGAEELAHRPKTTPATLVDDLEAIVGRLRDALGGSS